VILVCLALNDASSIEVLQTKLLEEVRDYLPTVQIVVVGPKAERRTRPSPNKLARLPKG
jgi:hypothetical protein